MKIVQEVSAHENRKKTRRTVGLYIDHLKAFEKKPEKKGRGGKRKGQQIYGERGFSRKKKERCLITNQVHSERRKMD